MASLRAMASLSASRLSVCAMHLSHSPLQKHSSSSCTCGSSITQLLCQTCLPLVQAATRQLENSTQPCWAAKTPPELVVGISSLTWRGHVDGVLCTRQSRLGCTGRTAAYLSTIVLQAFSTAASGYSVSYLHVQPTHSRYPYLRLVSDKNGSAAADVTRSTCRKRHSTGLTVVASAHDGGHLLGAVRTAHHARR